MKSKENDVKSVDSESQPKCEETSHQINDTNSTDNIKKVSEVAVPSAVEKRLFKCSSCPKVFRLKTLLRYHESLHKNSHKYQCDNCGRTFTDRDNLLAHIQTHETKMFGCVICSFFFSTLTLLGSHFRNIHGVAKR